MTYTGWYIRARVDGDIRSSRDYEWCNRRGANTLGAGFTSRQEAYDKGMWIFEDIEAFTIIHADDVPLAIAELQARAALGD